MKLLILLLPFFVSAQNFPNIASLSPGHGVPGTYDVKWKVNNQWLPIEPLPTLSLSYNHAYINNNCELGAWVNPLQLPTPVNNVNWITSDDATCINNTSGHRVFRLELNLLSACKGQDFNFNSLASGVYNYVIKIQITKTKQVGYI